MDLCTSACRPACVDNDRHQQRRPTSEFGVIKEGADLWSSLFLCPLYLQDWGAAGYPMAACAASGEMKNPVTQGAAVRCVCLGEGDRHAKKCVST